MNTNLNRQMNMNMNANAQGLGLGTGVDLGAGAGAGMGGANDFNIADVMRMINQNRNVQILGANPLGMGNGAGLGAANNLITNNNLQPRMPAANAQFNVQPTGAARNMNTASMPQFQQGTTTVAPAITAPAITQAPTNANANSAANNDGN